MRVRIGSVVLLILGLMVIVAAMTYSSNPSPSLPLAAFETGLILILVSIFTLRIKDKQGDF